MQAINVKIKENPYQILSGRGIVKLTGSLIKKFKLGSDAYIITNAKIKNKFGGLLYKSLSSCGINTKFKLVPDTEKSKSLITANSIIEDIACFDRKRQVFIIALGGGVIGDLAGFVAAIYKRGIAYINIPTTLLAQVDSSIGGKTAVDLRLGKNMVGAFYQPKLVIADTMLLETLDIRQMRAGISEVIKYGAIKDKRLFEFLEKNKRRVTNKNSRALGLVIKSSAAIKARIVELDEKEKKGLRTILNFGHTLGHAIESAGSYSKYNHGEAVALGMLIASDIGMILKITKPGAAARLENLIKKFGLPLKIKGIALKNIIKAHYFDKKFRGSQNKFVLMREIGKVKVVENIPLTIIKKAIEKRIR